MTVKQLSVFLENKLGGINDVVRILGQAEINMTAFSIAENADFGIMRVIVSDSDKAKEILKENHFAVSVTEVICMTCSNSAGSLSSILELLAAEKVFIEYMYAFSEGEKANIVIRPTDTKRCLELLEKNDCTILHI